MAEAAITLKPGMKVSAKLVPSAEGVTYAGVARSRGEVFGSAGIEAGSLRRLLVLGYVVPVEDDVPTTACPKSCGRSFIAEMHARQHGAGCQGKEK